VARRSGVRLVLSLIGLAVIISLGGLFLMVAAVSRGPSVPASAILVLRPAGSLPEDEPSDVLGQVLRRDAESMRSLVDGLRKAKRDPRIHTVLLRPGTLDLPYWGKLQELRDAVLDFRESGKTVIAFLEYGGDREYYLASAADRVFLLPTSPLDLTGVASYEVFLRGTLDKVGAYADYVHIGDYKSAPNQLTETGFTPAHREMAESINADMYAQLVQGVASGRHKTEEQVRALLDRGPFVPETALSEGLVDGLAYEDQLASLVPELGPEGVVSRIEGSEYRRVSAQSVGFRPRSRVALLYAVGTIVSGKSGYDAVNGSVIGSDTIVEQIRKIREDDSIRAIVLRIDSPGGSSVASDVIWRELMITREDNPARPLVASMSDLAASGGYYIAMSGDAIVAQPGTLTGSIGIYGGKITVGGVLEKLGVTTETVASGTNAAIYSPFEPFTAGQRAELQRFMQGFYDGFVQKVATSRRSTPEQIHAVAQGRVWTGRQALDHGLVDALGGLDVAIAMAKERANIPADEDVELVLFPGRRSFFEAFADQLGSGGGDAWSRLVGFGGPGRALASLAAPARLFRRGEPLALMPFAFVQ
jgi:protease-4